MVDFRKLFFGCCYTNREIGEFRTDIIETNHSVKPENHDNKDYSEKEVEEEKMYQQDAPTTQFQAGGPTEYEQEHITPFEDVPLSFNAIPESEIDKAPLLKLEIIEGFNTGAYYQINACGLVGVQGRGRRDGCVLVGSQEYAVNTDEPYNDIVLEAGDNSEIGRRHFLIKYNMYSYYLRDLGDGNGTFVRLDNPLLLKTGYIISFGDSHMFIQIVEDHNESLSNIEIKFLDGPKTDQCYSFSEPLVYEDSNKTRTIKIGRMADCDIKFNSKGLSRCQCIIEFINQCWVLKDGDGLRTSTNGTWLFADELYPIHDGMVFKAGQILFKSVFA